MKQWDMWGYVRGLERLRRWGTDTISVWWWISCICINYNERSGVSARYNGNVCEITGILDRHYSSQLRIRSGLQDHPCPYSIRQTRVDWPTVALHRGHCIYGYVFSFFFVGSVWEMFKDIGMETNLLSIIDNNNIKWENVLNTYA